eukprot:Mycagemm_TRINITY_DN9301_c0_g1::TRINITY_DN9301_c0_g1_i1::g.3280::m.3280 type:complete len:120 gc:universal TRINITY_DN9301_c0_g1_i1:344-703(+)
MLPPRRVPQMMAKAITNHSCRIGPMSHHSTATRLWPTAWSSRSESFHCDVESCAKKVLKRSLANGSAALTCSSVRLSGSRCWCTITTAWNSASSTSRASASPLRSTAMRPLPSPASDNM